MKTKKRKSRMQAMKRDIRKLADWLAEVCQEGVAIERRILEWKIEEKLIPRDQHPKAR